MAGRTLCTFGVMLLCATQVLKFVEAKSLAVVSMEAPRDIACRVNPVGRQPGIGPILQVKCAALSQEYGNAKVPNFRARVLQKGAEQEMAGAERKWNLAWDEARMNLLFTPEKASLRMREKE